MALQSGRVSFWIYLSCLSGVVFLHAAANTLNDYFDFKNGIDSKNSPTVLYRPHPIFCGVINLKGLFFFSLILFGATFMIALSFIFFGYKWLWLIIFSGIILAIFYTAGPKGFKYIALGEPAVFLAFGPLMLEGSYAAQTFQLSMKTLLISIPLGLLVSLVLLSNNLRDLDFDTKLKIKTLPIIIGRQNSIKLFRVIIITVFSLIFLYIACGILKWPSLIVFASLPLFIRLIRVFSKKMPESADAQTSQAVAFFGLLLLISLLINVAFQSNHTL